VPCHAVAPYPPIIRNTVKFVNRHETPSFAPTQFVNVDQFFAAFEGCEEIDADQFFEDIRNHIEDNPEQSS